MCTELRGTECKRLCCVSAVSQDKWRQVVAEGSTALEMFDHVTLMTLDSLLKCAFSYDSDCQR